MGTRIQCESYLLLPIAKDSMFGEGASSSRDEEAMRDLQVRKPFFEEGREGLLGRVGSDLRGSSVTLLPSNPEIRGKGQLFGDLWNVGSGKLGGSQGDDGVSSLGEFQIEGLSPRKMAKVREVLCSLDIKVGLPFYEEEIYKAIFQLDRDKAPGPDGFTIAVFQDCWDVIKEDLVRVLQSFTGYFMKLFILLNAFVQGRQILDAVLIANEIVDEKRRSGRKELYSKSTLKRLTTICTEQDVIESRKEIRWRFQDSQEFIASVWAYFGLKVNLDKSNIYGINLEQNHLSRLAKLLDCKASVIERISRRLDGWQKAYLSFEGLGKVKDHLVSWDVVCKSKARGGLGFGKIVLRNVTLLGKWLWRYPREGSTLWHQAIAQVFQEFSKFTRFVVGDGKEFGSGRLVMRDPGIYLLQGFLQSNFFLALSQCSGSSPVFLTKFVWNSQIPFKVKSFVWLVAHKKVFKGTPLIVLQLDWLAASNSFGLV
ncbi:hypothetical protein CK203_056570 [Vitis vinifera]|uniref:Reverse transcriptase zinc-binding domain-containing protein n=1 Tax=Vitis vinifera TaxID=29760 RepID=A0A438GKE1_VITVI|nr:hypothetical protein CK203_056570 [Vitis vinifera]